MIIVSRCSITSRADRVGRAPVEALPDQLVEVRKALAAHDHEVVAVDLLEGCALVGDHLAQLRQDQVEDTGHAQGAPERLGGRAERLGLLARGALGLEQARVLDCDRSLGGEPRRKLRELLGCRSRARTCRC